MTYCISDLHGCYQKYRQMMIKIGFCDRDTLFVLGDVVDRGAHGIDILLDIAARENVILLRGNHDVTAASLLRFCSNDSPEWQKPEFQKTLALWRSDGGEPTFQDCIRRNGYDRRKALSLVFRSPYHTEVTVGGRCYHLSHTLPEYEVWKSGNVKDIDFILGEPDYETVYDENKYFVTGHTPTGLIDFAKRGHIVQMNHHIAIDCGAVFGNSLGCICLETGKEYYV